jgi:hypothetical protein
MQVRAENDNEPNSKRPSLPLSRFLSAWPSVRNFLACLSIFVVSGCSGTPDQYTELQKDAINPCAILIHLTPTASDILAMSEQFFVQVDEQLAVGDTYGCWTYEKIIP